MREIHEGKFPSESMSKGEPPSRHMLKEEYVKENMLNFRLNR